MKNDDRDIMRMYAQQMGDNEFFRQFISKYQKGLNRALKKTLENTDAEKNAEAFKSPKKKAPDGANKPPKKANFGKMIMDHVSNTNYYRKNLPAIFTGKSNTDHSSILQDKLKTLAPVPLPINLQRANEH